MKTRSQQRAILLNHLKTKQRITTLQARNELDIMHPGGRVLELRQAGYEIITYWRTVGEHRVAEYVYFGGGDAG